MRLRIPVHIPTPIESTLICEAPTSTHADKSQLFIVAVCLTGLHVGRVGRVVHEETHTPAVGLVVSAGAGIEQVARQEGAAQVTELHFVVGMIQTAAWGRGSAGRRLIGAFWVKTNIWRSQKQDINPKTVGSFCTVGEHRIAS